MHERTTSPDEVIADDTFHCESKQILILCNAINGYFPHDVVPLSSTEYNFVVNKNIVLFVIRDKKLFPLNHVILLFGCI